MPACLSLLMNPPFIMFCVIVKLLLVFLVLLASFFRLYNFVVLDSLSGFHIAFHVYGALCCDKPE